MLSLICFDQRFNERNIVFSIHFSISDELFCFEPATLSLSDYQHCFDFDALKSFWKHDLINTTEI